MHNPRLYTCQFYIATKAAVTNSIRRTSVTGYCLTNIPSFHALKYEDVGVGGEAESGGRGKSGQEGTGRPTEDMRREVSNDSILSSPE